MALLRSINQDDLRNHNLSVVLDTMLRSRTPMSRAELAKATGLTKAAMSVLVPMLIAADAVREGNPSPLSDHGRPSTPLVVEGGRFCGLGLQVHTDGYGAKILDLAGRTVVQRWICQPMGDTDPDDIFARLEGLVADCESASAAQGRRIVGAGLALPGLVTADMRLLTARNLGWERVDLRRFAVVSRLDVRADNEANMAALAQISGYATQRHGTGMLEPSDSFVYVSTDIGIGGAVVRDGHVDRGTHGFAGELGHVSVALHGVRCRCGRRGCLEAYAGRRALIESAGVARGDRALRIEAVDELIRRWQAGDARAVAAIDRAVQAMTSAMASCINVLDVDTVILGGLWERFGVGLAARMEECLAPQVLGSPEARVRVLMTQSHAHPALDGAAQVGLRRFLDNPLAHIEG